MEGGKHDESIKKIFVILLATVMTISLAACKKDNESQKESDTSKSDSTGSINITDSEDNSNASVDPFGAYENEITVTMGRQTLQNPKLPEGDTYEDNAYTRWVKNELNIKIVDEFEANGDDYDRQVSLAISSGDLPDING